MLCYCIYKMAFQKIIIVLELIDVFNRLCAWNFYLVEGWAACQEDKNKSREASTWQIHSQGLPGFCPVLWTKCKPSALKAKKEGPSQPAPFWPVLLAVALQSHQKTPPRGRHVPPPGPQVLFWQRTALVRAAKG